jgi:hypothetical protein
MNTMNADLRHAQHMETLSRLVVRAHCETHRPASVDDLEQLKRDLWYVATLDSRQREDLLSLANSNHVIVRALNVLKEVAALEDEGRVAEWCEQFLAEERVRIERAVTILHSVCDVLERHGCKVAVIKSLDHFPDLGSDLDLYTTADEENVRAAMQEEMHAYPVERSWGDRLANKWNFKVPGLPELVEIHVQYLGQTGEHVEMAKRVIDRRRTRSVEGHQFWVTAPEEQIVISALQRVYRHFYFRLCDMVDIAQLLQSGSVDFRELEVAAESAGIWPGVATFLCLVRNYVECYGGELDLPTVVEAAAHAPESSVRFKNGFLRVSKTTAAGLYSSQLVHAGVHRDLRALLRLPLLPPLAVSALVAHSITGDDKGIW